ncbi:MAG: hypothetical protein IPF79_04975 [Ignavibacteria bacterium]|nr:hypothetical protein [Ignavibacteria bacterium]
MTCRFKQMMYSLLTLWVMGGTASYAQGSDKVIVILQSPPPYQFKIEHMWKVTLTNLTQESIPIVLEGVATTPDYGLIVRANTVKFNLPPGTKVLSAAEMQPISIQQTSAYHEDVVKKTGNVPTGNYEICVSAIDTRSNVVIGRGCVQATAVQMTRIQLLQPSNNARFILGTQRAATPTSVDDNGSQKVRSILNSIVDVVKDPLWVNQPILAKDTTGINRPILDKDTSGINQPILPKDTNVVNRPIVEKMEKIRVNRPIVEKMPAMPYTGGTITFGWLPPAPTPPGVQITYTLRLVERIGRQSGYDALKSNPSVIEMKGLANTVVILPIAARRLEAGKSYAWNVEVYLNNVLMQQSEVFDLAFNKISGPGHEGRCFAGCGCPPEDRRAPLFTDVHTGAATRMPSAHRSLYQDIPPEIAAAPDAPAFALTGNGSIEYQNANRVGSFSTVPKNFATANLNPGVKLYGLPFTANILLSTQQDSSRQSMNMFAFNFDFNAMREGLANRLKQSIEQEMNEHRAAAEAAVSQSYPKLDDPNELRTMTESEISAMQAEKQAKIDQLVDIKAEATYNVNSLSDPNDLSANLKKHGGISGAESFFMGVRSLGVGTNYPSYSDYILSGVPVTGVNAEIDQGLLYTAFTAVTNQRPVDNVSYGRELYAGRLGVGRLEGTHVIFTGMYVNDDPTSISSTSLDPTLTPRQNTAFGVDISVNLFNNVLSLQGEADVSVLTRDTRDPALETDVIPAALANIVQPRVSSQVDYVYSAKLVFNNPESGTRASAGYKMVGPGYASLGVPYLRTDIQGFEVLVDQYLFNYAVQIGGFAKQYKDNLIDWKSSTTTMTNLGVTLGLNIPDLPYLRVSYMPTTQKNDDTVAIRQLNTDLNVYSLSTGYTVFVDSWSFATSLNVNGQQTTNSNGLNNFASTNYLLTENISFSFPLNLGLSYGIVESESSVGYRIINSMEVNASYPLAAFLQANAGLNLAAERGQNDRFGFFAAAYLMLSEALNLNIRAEKTTYNDALLMGNSYDEFIFSATITSRW